MLYYLTVLVYTKTTIHPSVGGLWWIPPLATSTAVNSVFKYAQPNTAFLIGQRRMNKWIIECKNMSAFRDL